jgi:hypothetical protein
MVGSHAYCRVPPKDQGRDVAALCNSRAIGKTCDQLEAAGWQWQKHLPGNMELFSKEKDNLFFLTELWRYDAFKMATEVCKALDLKDVPADKQLARAMHQIIMDGKVVKIHDINGALQIELLDPPPQLENDWGQGLAGAQMGGAGVVGGFANGNWNPPPVVDLDAGEAANIEVALNNLINNIG